MANIVLKTFAAGDEGQGTVTPQDDSLIYQNAVSVNGIFGGATVTLTGANTLHVASGLGIICGRFFEINESDISVQLSSSGTLSGRLKIHLDLNNADNPIEIVTETGSSLPALTGDSNININGGAFDMELCTFSVNELTISSLVNTFPTIDNTSKQIRRKTAYAVNDFVLCQSASDALIFICTTAGTTAVQEPTGYTTITDGNTITDGTAVFKAVSVSGQIAQISKIGNMSSLNTTDKSSAVAAINEVNTKVSKTEDLIAYVQTSLVASKAYAVGEQFVYNGLLYEVTAAIASGGTITIGSNCKLADNVTNQILLLTSELNKLKNATRRTQRNITTDLANLPTAVSEQNLEKYGYSIGDYFIGNSGYIYFLADMNTFRGGQSDLAVINQNHISIVVKTGANSKWNESNDTSTGYSGSVLHSYLSGTVLNNIKSDMIALFGGSTGLEHLLSHKLLWTTATSSWDWSANAQYISALTEPQIYGTNVWAIDGFQTGEAWKHLEIFKKFSYMEILGWIWFWLRSIRSASGACLANHHGGASYDDASPSGGVVGLIVFK